MKNVQVQKVNQAKQKCQHHKGMVSVVVPAYNEEALVEKNLWRLCNYMDSLNTKYRYELIFINDGSLDRTGEIAEKFAETRKNVRVYHHFVNMQLGEALKTAFHCCKGDYIITMDLDLSYSPEHIQILLDKIIETQAQIIIASPYMKGGSISNVPWRRRLLSRWANRFLSLTYKGKLSTITGMVRAYERRFIESLNLKATDMEINAEILYKAQLLRARILEIPAHLDWCVQKQDGQKRTSSMRILRGIMASLMSAFIFRPFLFFMIPGLILLLIALYIIGWIFINTLAIYPEAIVSSAYFDDQFSHAVAMVFEERPHAFLVGGSTLLVALQLLSLGILSLQSKRYFEELFHFCTTIYKHDLNTMKLKK